MGWPKGKKRMKKNNINKSIDIDNLNKEQTKQLVAELEQINSIHQSIVQAREILREPFHRIELAGEKIYFISLKFWFCPLMKAINEQTNLGSDVFKEYINFYSNDFGFKSYKKEYKRALEFIERADSGKSLKPF